MCNYHWDGTWGCALIHLLVSPLAAQGHLYCISGLLVHMSRRRMQQQKMGLLKSMSYLTDSVACSLLKGGAESVQSSCGQQARPRCLSQQHTIISHWEPLQK